MRFTPTDSRLREHVDRRRSVRSTSKLVLAIVAATFLLFLGSLLPGIDRVVPATGLSLAAIVRAVVTVAVVSLLVRLAGDLAALTRLAFDAPRVIAENVSSVVHWLVLLAAVIVAHWGLAAAVTALVPAWAYDVAFLALSLPPLAFVAARLYHTLDPAADLLADRVVAGSTDDEPMRDGDSSGDAESSDPTTADGADERDE